MLASGTRQVHDLGGHAFTPASNYDAPMSSEVAHHRSSRRPTVGDHLRHWRQLRRLSQQDLALDAQLSTRHLSCVETGRASPSRELVLRLCDRLAVPLRERNAWLASAGYAPMYREQSLDDSTMRSARRAIQHILDGHEPWPAVAFDRHWNMVLHNRMIAPFLAGVAPELLKPPINLLRISLHPQGLAPSIVNLNQWRTHLFARLRSQEQTTGDEALSALLAELMAYPGRSPDNAVQLDAEVPGVLMPFLIETPLGVLNLISTITIFGSPTDITLQELALETFFPGDDASASMLRALAAASAP